jgi:hypothetical protein
LYDFGQTGPTYYNFTPEGFPNFTAPVSYSSTNNIFINNTLFNIYSRYINDTIVPLLAQQAFAAQGFLPLDSNNSLKPTPTAFLRSYSCVQKQLKGWVSVFISVLVADFAFITGGYTLVLLVAGWLQAHVDGDSGKISLQLNWSLANKCPGCESNGNYIPLRAVGKLRSEEEESFVGVSK